MPDNLHSQSPLEETASLTPPTPRRRGIVHERLALHGLDYPIAPSVIHRRSPALTNALVGALADSVDQVHLAVADALAMGGVRLKEAVPGVVAVLKDTAHARERAQAALILGAFGFVARDTVPKLTAALRDPAASVRANARQALGRIGISAAESGPSIVPLLHDMADYVRLRASFKTVVNS